MFIVIVMTLYIFFSNYLDARRPFKVVTPLELRKSVWGFRSMQYTYVVRKHKNILIRSNYGLHFYSHKN